MLPAMFQWLFLQLLTCDCACAQAIAGAGFDWKFSEVAVLGLGLSGFFMRSMSVVVSIGGMLITALLLGIVSGEQAGK